MFETYRMLGEQREAELLRDARRFRVRHQSSPVLQRSPKRKELVVRIRKWHILRWLAVASRP
jgi:hypothetical protein